VSIQSNVVLRGRQAILRPFGSSDITPRYLAWLNDPEVNRYSRRFGMQTSADEARRYLEGLAPGEVILSIETAEHGHVGNIKYGPIDYHNSRADISIVLGEKRVWGRGIATAAIYLVARHLFEIGLNRVEAGSANPAFLRAVAKLGWRVEGVQRARVRIGEQFLDWSLVGQLRNEFVRISALEPVGSEMDVSASRIT
jgi:ribosomal-protein-alanine N-acetyltransferase